MEITETEHFFRIDFFEGAIEIQKDGSQIRVEREEDDYWEDEYVDTDIDVLAKLRDTLNKIIQD